MAIPLAGFKPKSEAGTTPVPHHVFEICMKSPGIA